MLDDRAEAPAQNAERGALRLAEWGLIRVEGADAVAFLQGQLTQEIARLEPGRAALAGYCSPKGRLLATFVGWKDGEDVCLAATAELVPAVAKRLSMFVLRARCRVRDATASVSLWGSAGASDADVRPAAGEVRRVGESTRIGLPAAAGIARRLVVMPIDGVPPEATGAPELSVAAWNGLEAASGVPRITGATVERFVPQMVNLDLVDGVSFAKGCYPGQEVVARSQYRGTVKRRMFRFDADEPLEPGDDIYEEGEAGEPAGVVVNAGAWGGGFTALVETKLSAMESGKRLRAGRPEGASLRKAELPYPVRPPA